MSSLSRTNLNIEASSCFKIGGTYDKKKGLIFLKICLCGKLCVNFRCVALKDISCTMVLLAKFELPARANDLLL